jgi:diacylglycerol kinase family enzyme
VGHRHQAGPALLVIPAGTFNHFAADLDVEGARDALAALRDGEAVQADLGLAGSRPFVNTMYKYSRRTDTNRDHASTAQPAKSQVTAMYRVLKRYRVKLVKVNMDDSPSCSSVST